MGAHLSCDSTSHAAQTQCRKSSSSSRPPGAWSVLQTRFAHVIGNRSGATAAGAGTTCTSDCSRSSSSSSSTTSSSLCCCACCSAMLRTAASYVWMRLPGRLSADAVRRASPRAACDALRQPRWTENRGFFAPHSDHAMKKLADCTMPHNSLLKRHVRMNGNIWASELNDLLGKQLPSPLQVAQRPVRPRNSHNKSNIDNSSSGAA